EQRNFRGAGYQLQQQLQPLRHQLGLFTPTPVRLPPGRLRLDTRPSATGSGPVMNRTGIVAVATFAACADAAPPVAAISDTRRRTSRPASAGTERIDPPPSAPRGRVSAPQYPRRRSVLGGIQPAAAGTGRASHC